jgi:hypothetical protein
MLYKKNKKSKTAESCEDASVSGSSFKKNTVDLKFKGRQERLQSAI